MSKIIKGYLTNFSEDKNFTAGSQGYISAMEALAAKQAFENSIKARLDWNRTQEGKATPAERKLHAIPNSVRKYVPEDYTYAGGNGQVDEGTGLAPLGIGLGALAGAAALGYGAYRLAKKKAELKANGYYAFDNEITKETCRNIDNPARTRAQLRKQYPNSRIIKGNTAYQLNPQEFKVAANFSQENFAEDELNSNQDEMVNKFVESKRQSIYDNCINDPSSKFMSGRGLSVDGKKVFGGEAACRAEADSSIAKKFGTNTGRDQGWIGENTGRAMLNRDIARANKGIPAPTLKEYKEFVKAQKAQQSKPKVSDAERHKTNVSEFRSKLPTVGNTLQK